jgi:putative heme iron utilization protein
VVAATERRKDPLAAGRVTLAGRVTRPSGDTERVARAAYLASVPTASMYAEFGDFSLYVLGVERVRWVGGYGRMDSADAEAYANAQADPVGEARAAITHLNDDHADALLVIAQALGGYPDATAAQCSGLDRRGIDLAVHTPRGRAPARVAFRQALAGSSQLRAATVELTHRARAAAGSA